MLARAFARALAPLALLVPPAAAQDLAWSSGVLGLTLEVPVAATPGELAFGLPSLASGPTPLAPLDPSTALALDVGLDLFSLLQVRLVGPGGVAAFAWPLPANPTLSGLPVRVQAFTVALPGSVTGVTNVGVATLTDLGESHPTPGAAGLARRDHSATTLPGGRVLLVGGRGAPGQPWPLAIELFDPISGDFLPTGLALAAPRAHHTATRLLDGSVLIAGGVRDDGTVLASALRIAADAGSMQVLPPMGEPRVLHSATRLDDGRVLLAGGADAFTPSHPLGWPASFAAGALSGTTELFVPAQDAWLAGPGLGAPRSLHADALRSDGSVTLVGGMVPVAGVLQTSAAALRYVPAPAPGSFQMLPALPAPRAGAASLELEDARLIVVGGATIDVPSANWTGHPQCWTLAPGAGAWVAAPATNGIVSNGRVSCVPKPSLPSFPSGPEIEIFVYFAGGGVSDVDLATGATTPGTAVEMIAPDLSGWLPAGSFAEAREGAAVENFPGGYRWLVTGHAPGAAPGDPGGELYTVDWIGVP